MASLVYEREIGIADTQKISEMAQENFDKKEF